MEISQINPVLKLINLFPCESGFCTNERFLPNPYFLYVHKGKGRFVINGVSYSAGIGDLFFCARGIGNTIIADDKDPFVLSGIDFFFTKNSTLCTDIDNFEDHVGFFPKINIASQRFAEMLIHEMIEEYNHKKSYSAGYSDALLKTFIILIAGISHSISNPGQSNIQEILEYIRQNTDREVTLSELSKVFNYHPSSINRMVGCYTGMSVRQYQIDIKIKKAMDLLLYTQKSISEVSAMCGFNSIFYFSRLFTQKTGMMPSAYRSSIMKR